MSEHLSRQFSVRYDPFTQTVSVVDNYQDTNCMIEVTPEKYVVIILQHISL